MGTESPFKFKNKKLLLCFLFVTLIHVTNAGTCQDGCPTPNKSSKYTFAPGSVYTYNLESVITIYLSGNDAQETTIKVLGQAKLIAQGNCGYILKLERLQITSPNGKNNLMQPELLKPVRFIMSNDEIVPEICTEINENEFSLNIKRAIISMIQSNVDKNYETDVFGVCPTIFTSTTSGKNVIVNKIRNLNSCNHRESIVSGFITSVINENSGVKSTPLLNGDYSMEQRIKNGILDNVVINEEYNFIPFSTGDTGVRAKVVNRLTYVSTSQNVGPQIVTPIKKTIIFENVTPTIVPNIKDNVKNALKNTVQSYENNVGEKSARTFTELIRLMRSTKREDLFGLHQQIRAGTIHKNSELANKIYFDALFRTGTGDSVEVSTNLLKKMNEKERKLFYLSLNFVQSMTQDALNTIVKLLDNNPPKEAYLGVGKLVSQYCAKYSCDGNEIKGVIDKYVAKLGNCKADNRHQEDTIVAVLKGLRNTNNVKGTALNSVIVCTSDKSSTRIRVAALQTLVAAGCNKNAEQTSLNILKNRNEDSEIRIEAYLSAISCPNGQLANEIKKLLDEETVYQVGSYITSHLSSLRSSTDSTRRNAREHFSNIRTTNKFPNDFRRYSFNNELSYGVDSMGIGGSLDTNIIYSQKSYLPRSAKLNFTGEIFGNSFNIFEVNARQENLDYMVEHYFGPKGFFNSGSKQSIYDKIVSQYKLAKEPVNKRRTSRGIKEDSNAFLKTVNMGNEVNADLDIDLSLKMFGSEMYFLSFGENTISHPKEFITKFFECIDKAITSTKKYDNIFESHHLFLDTELVYPTGFGFPLKFIGQGTGVVRIETSVAVDLPETFKDPDNTKLNVKLIPSANYQLTGTLSVDAYLVTAGIQVSGSVHSSTGTNIKLEVLNGAGIDISLGLPLKKQELFSFEHKVVFISQDRGVETVETLLKFSSKTQPIPGRFDQLQQFIGLTFSSEGTLTVPGTIGVAPFPLNGNNKFKIWLEIDQDYHFKVLGRNTTDPFEQSLYFEFDTPGSKINRKTTLTLLVGVQEAKTVYGRATLVSQIKNGHIEIGIKNAPNELVLYMEGKNEAEDYLAKIGFKKGGTSNRQEYTPIALYKSPNRKDESFFGYSVKGVIISENQRDGSKFTFNNVQIVYQNQDPFIITGFIAHENFKFTTDMTFSKSGKKGTLKGSVEVTQQIFNFDISFVSSFKNAYNGRVVIELQNIPKNYRTKLIVISGNDLNSPKDRIEYYGYSNEKNINDIVTNEFGTDFRVPFIQFSYKQDAVTSSNRLSYKLDVGYSKHKLNTNIEGKFNKVIGQYEVDVSAGFNSHGFKFISNKRPIDSTKYRWNNKFTTFSGIQAELNGVIAQSTNVDINLEGLLILVDKQEPYKFVFVLSATQKLTNSNGKITIGKQEFLSYDIKINKGENTNGAFEIKMKDILSGNGDFKLLNGKGDANLLVHFNKFGRKVKTDVKFNIAGPLVDFSTDFYYDYEKDNTKKASFSTNTRIDNNKFDSKNNMEIFSEKYNFNIQGSKQGPSVNDGTIKGKFSLILPTGRIISGEINRDVHIKTDNANGLMDIKFEDRLPTKKTRTLLLHGKINSADFRSKLFDIYHKITYTDYDNKNIIIDNTLKHFPRGQHKGGSINFGIKGKLIQEPIELILLLDEYSNEHATYNFNGKYGNIINGGIKGKYHVGGRSIPISYDITLTLVTPKSTMETIKFESSGSLLKPDTEGGILDLKFKTNAEMGQRKIDFNTNVRGNAHNGVANIYAKLGEQEPLQAAINYLHEEKEGSTKCTGSVKFEFGRGQIIALNGDVSTVGHNEITVHGKLQTPFEKYRTAEVNFNTAHKNDENYVTKATLVSEDKKFSWESTLVLSQRYPSIDITFVLPQQTVRFYTSFAKLGERKYKGEIIMKNFIDFNFDGAGEISYQNLDSFYVKLDANSNALKLNKLHMEINSKHGANSKGIEFKASTDNKNILQGYADFTIKEEKGKTVIEGQGSVKLYDKQRAANFNLIRNNFEATKDGETGFMYIFSGTVGPQRINSELKITDKNFQTKHTICEEKKQCINIELRSILKQITLENFNHEFFITADLRELGYENEFSLTSIINADIQKYDHTIDLLVQSKDKRQYQYKFYYYPNQHGLTLTLPSRIISIESVAKIPENIFGKYDIGFIIYLDKKNQPNNKGTIGFTGDLIRTKQIINYNGDFKIIHPSIKSIIISFNGEINGERKYTNGRLELDIFKNVNQKIIVTGRYGNTDITGRGFNITNELNLISNGLKLDYNYNSHTAISFDRRQFSTGLLISSPYDELKFSTFLFGSDEIFEFIVTGHNEEFINTNARFDIGKVEANFNSRIKFLRSEPLTINAKSSQLSSVTFNLNRGKLAKVDGEFTIGREIRLVITGPSKEIFRGRIALDQGHFLSTEYKVHDKEAKEFLKAFQDTLKSDYINAKNEISERTTKLQNSLKAKSDAVQSALPDLTNLKNDYQRQMQKLTDELMADKTIKAVVELVHLIFHTFEDILNKIVPVIVDSCEKITETISNFNKFLIDLIQQRFVPIVKDLLEKLESVLSQIYMDTINLLSEIIERSVKILKLFEDDFNKVAKVFAELFKNFSTIFNSTFNALRKELTDLVNMIIEQIKSCPGFDELKKQFSTFFDEHKVPEYVIALIKEFSTIIQRCSPTTEIGDFFRVITEYIDLKLRNSPVDDSESFKKMYNYFARAIRSILNLIRTPTSETSGGLFSPIPFTYDSIKHLPILTNLKLSPLNYMKNEQPLSVRELFTAYRPYGFEMNELYPPFTMRARIADGSHIFTFDGKHLTFPGSCQYILAQDFVNNNFSIIATLNNGKMKSVGIVSKNEFMELNDQGIVTVNGKPQDLPAHGRELHSWRNFYTTSILSLYGAKVTCSIDLRICNFKVSGFYLGKLRGLLGNGNGEKYDDFTLPTGKITTNFADFGNAYKSSKGNCPTVPFVNHEEHAHHHSDVCNEIFSGDSELRVCFYFIDPSNYREACEHAVATAKDKQDAACNIAEVYTSACVKESIPVKIPGKCKKCKNNNNLINVNDKYTVKVPTKQADIVFVVDTAIGTQYMGELVQATITDLRKELKNRQMIDTNIIVIGYNKNQKYIYQLTSNGKLDFTGRLGQIKFEGPTEEKSLVTGCKEFDEYLSAAHHQKQILKEDLGLTADARAFQQAISYPFRSSASKVIIAVRNDNLNYSANPTKYFGALVQYEAAIKRGIALHVITPINDLVHFKDQKQIKNIVGFNSKTVLLINDKKKTDLGNAEFRKNIKFDSDLGIGFVESSNGYVYVLQNYINAKKDKKNYISVVAISLADQISRTEIISDCVCKINHGLYPEEHCTVKQTKLLPARKIGSRG